jgi:hypothetical protein
VASFPEGRWFARSLDPYRILDTVKKALGHSTPDSSLPVSFIRSSQFIASLTPAWRLEHRFQRGTLLFIYIAWIIDQLQKLRLRLLRGGFARRFLAQAAITPLIQLLFLVMRIDFMFSPPIFYYNNVLCLRKTS